MSSTTTFIGRTEHFAWNRRTLQPDRPSAATISQPWSTDATCSAVSRMSINELRECIYAPFGRDAEAITVLQESLKIRRTVGIRLDIAYSLARLGMAVER